MTIQWTLVAAFLYGELIFITLLLLPFISPKIWLYIFQSRMCKVVASKAHMFFFLFIIVLVFFFFDSIREMHKYSSGHDKVTLDATIQLNMKLFRSQRNYYIAGIALFLWLVIRRLIMLISINADLLKECETSMKKAQAATETAQKLLKQKDEMSKENISIDDDLNQKYEEEAIMLKEKIHLSIRELAETNSAITSLKDKSQNLSEEYLSLTEKHKILQNTVENIKKKDK